MAWKQFKQFEALSVGTSIVAQGGTSLPTGIPNGTKIRVTYEVQEPRYKAVDCGGNYWRLVNTENGVVWGFGSDYPGGPQAAAVAEAARLNAIEEAAQ